MVELRVGVRLAAEGAEARGPWDSGARVQLVPLPEADLRFPEGQRAFHDWAETDVWLPAADEYRQSFVSPYGNLSGITVRVATFGGDLSPGEGTLGSNSVNVLALPVDGEPVASLAANSVVTVLGAAEGWARVELPDGATGFVPQEAFVQLPESERQVGDVNFSLRDASGTVVREALIPAESIRDNAHLSVLFDPLPESAGQSFTFRFGPADPTLGSFTLRATTEDAYAEGALLDDGATGDLIFRPVYAEQPPLFDLPIDALPRDDDWFIVEDPPDVPAGIAAGLRLVPGDREDAGRVHFGVTTERAPYGTTRATDTVGSSLPGALLMTTTWERDVDLRGITEDGFANLRGFASDDPVMTAVYITLLITMSAITVKLWPVMFPRRSRRD
jgi:hypothetical protein